MAMQLTGSTADPRISRRVFAKGMAATGAVALLAGAAKRTFAANKGGTLKLGMQGGNASDVMDPMLGVDNVIRAICYATYDTLVELSPSAELTPSLATDWSTDKEAKDWIFDIRKGVEFHNGKTLTAADVVYSIQRHMGPDTQSPFVSLLASVDTIVAENDHQVRIVLKDGNADFVYFFEDYKLGIVQDGFDDWNNAIGAGAYKLTEFEPGVRAIGERNPNYWKEGRAHVDSYELVVVNDSTARSNGLSTGVFHAINSVERKVALRLAESPGIAIIVSPGKDNYTCAMTASADPYSNNHLRLAMKYGFNRQQAIDRAFSGFGDVGNDHPLARSDPFFHSELPQREYDPDKASWHFQQSGLGSHSAELFTSPAAGSEAIDVAQIYQEALKQVQGLDLTITRTPADGYWSNIWMKRPFFMSYWTARPTADLILSYAYTSSAKYNESQWKNEKFDQLITAAKVETDFDTRKQMYWDAQELLHNEGGSIVYAFPDLIDAHGEKLGGLGKDFVRAFAGSRVIERVWLEG